MKEEKEEEAEEEEYRYYTLKSEMFYVTLMTVKSVGPNLSVNNRS